MGKTVLLGAFAERAADANWEPAELEFQPSHNTDEAIGEALLGGLLQRTRERLSRFERLRAAAGRAIRGGNLSVSWEDVSLSLAPGSERESDLARDIFETVELAVGKGREGLVLLLDEAQLIRDERGRHGEYPLSLLLAPLVALQRQELPLAVVVCGLLPVDEALDASFAPWRGPDAWQTKALPQRWSKRWRAIRTSSSSGNRSCGTQPTSPASIA